MVNSLYTCSCMFTFLQMSHKEIKGIVSQLWHILTYVLLFMPTHSEYCMYIGIKGLVIGYNQDMILSFCFAITIFFYFDLYFYAFDCWRQGIHDSGLTIIVYKGKSAKC